MIRPGDFVRYTDTYAGRTHVVRGTVTAVYGAYFDMTLAKGGGNFVQGRVSKATVIRAAAEAVAR